MSDFDRNLATARTGYRTDQVAIDAGLRAYMIRVYNYMATGVALTGVVAWLTFVLAGGDAVHFTSAGLVGATAFGTIIYSTVVQIALFAGTFGIVWFVSSRVGQLDVGTALTLFMVYAALLGLFLSPIFVEYTGGSITRVFFLSAASFGGLSLYGYTTQRDLSPMGAFLVMGLIGLVGAVLLNIVLGLFGIYSSAFTFLISVVGVLIFAGLTAWDTQRIKEMYSPMDDGTAAGRKAVMGALTLYLDFINLFLFMLRLLGNRR
jgi:FtsH-binding integral membrane protein